MSVFAPDFSVTLAGRRLPAELRAAVTGLRHESGLNKADRVELTLANPGLRFLDDQRLRIKKELALSLGYAGKPLRPVFAGEIAARSASFPSDAGPSLTIVAQDRLGRLQEGMKERWFAVSIPTQGNYAIPDPGIAATIAAEHGLVPRIDPISAALSVLLGGVEAVAAGGDPVAAQKAVRKQQNESDFDFLRRIGLENGWEMHIESDQPGVHVLRFMSPSDYLTPDVTLGWGRSLVEFSPRVSEIGQLISVTGFVWVSQIKTGFAVTVGWDWDTQSLVLSIAPSVDPTREGPSDYLVTEPLTALTAPRTLIGHLLPRLNQRLTATGRILGDPRVRPGRVVRIEGVGVEFGGLYRVVSTVHTLGADGFHTSFELRKEVWFGSIPPAEQGAFPVRLEAPFVS
jgi:phage protein D